MPPLIMGNTPVVILSVLMLVIFWPAPDIFVAFKVFVELFQVKLRDCNGAFVPLPTINCDSTKVLTPMPPLIMGNTPVVILSVLMLVIFWPAPDIFVAFKVFVELFQVKLSLWITASELLPIINWFANNIFFPVPPLDAGNKPFVCNDKLIKLLRVFVPVPPLVSGSIPLVCNDKLIKLVNSVAPVPPLLVSKTPAISEELKLICILLLLSTIIPPLSLIFKFIVLISFIIPTPPNICPALENWTKLISSVSKVVKLDVLNTKPEFLFILPFLTNIKEPVLILLTLLKSLLLFHVEELTI